MPLKRLAAAKIFAKFLMPKENVRAAKSLASPAPMGTGRLKIETNKTETNQISMIIAASAICGFPQNSAIRTGQISGIRRFFISAAEASRSAAIVTNIFMERI